MFKVGDEIVCIDANSVDTCISGEQYESRGRITVGHRYKVLSVRERVIGKQRVVNRQSIFITDDEGKVDYPFRAELFRLRNEMYSSNRTVI